MFTRPLSGGKSAAEMTIYLSQPYYRRPMHVPVQRILAAMQAERNSVTR